MLVFFVAVLFRKAFFIYCLFMVDFKPSGTINLLKLFEKSNIQINIRVL